MSDALLSPVVGGAFWAGSGALIAYSAKKIAAEHDATRTPLMGVMGAFVFAAQMVNFSIPGTGSSGHLVGGILLAALLGPYRAFITVASVLVVQCLCFADGGLLALGCNIFNMGFFPTFIAFPFIFQKITGVKPTARRLAAGSIAAAMAGLLFGAFTVVLQTKLSGISALPFGTFVWFMLPIHLAIGAVEGVVTWSVLAFVAQAQPGLLTATPAAKSPPRLVLTAFAVATLVLGGFVSWFASTHPDGLEWSIAKVTGTKELAGANDRTHAWLARLQETIVLLPDYSFRAPPTAASTTAVPASVTEHFGTSLSGVVGSLLVLLLAGLAGFLLRARTVELKTEQ
jgi:cobalt/nickel transport system permease protein